MIERGGAGPRRSSTSTIPTATSAARTAPGEIRAALLGRPADRRAPARQEHVVRHLGRRPGRGAGPTLGIHLGMSGKIVIADGHGHEIDGGDYWERGRAAGRLPVQPVRADASPTAARCCSIDPRRLGRVRLDPPVEAARPRRPRDHDGPVPGDGGSRHRADQGPPARSGGDRRGRQPAGRPGAVAGQDQPGPPGRRAQPRPRSTGSTGRCSARSRPRSSGGGVHTLSIVPFRKAEALCPRDGAPMVRGTVGGRTTWWC